MDCWQLGAHTGTTAQRHDARAPRGRPHSGCLPKAPQATWQRPAVCSEAAVSLEVRARCRRLDVESSSLASSAMRAPPGVPRYAVRAVRAARPRLVRVPSTYSTRGPGGKPPCASGTYPTREAGTRSPYVPNGVRRGVRVSSGRRPRRGIGAPAARYRSKTPTPRGYQRGATREDRAGARSRHGAEGGSHARTWLHSRHTSAGRQPSPAPGEVQPVRQGSHSRREARVRRVGGTCKARTRHA